MTLEAVSFTASRDRDGDWGGTAVNLLSRVPQARRYVTGGARGGDAFIGRWLAFTYPAAEHVIVLPHNRSQAEPWWETWPFPLHVTLIEMPAGATATDRSGRNQRIVDEGTVVYGLPAYEEHDPRSQRSGTWQTIRMARRARKLISWCCVKPPYTGQIEGNINHFLARA